MAYETGAPPPPEHTPIEIVQPGHDDPLRPALRPAAGYEATAVISGLGGPR